MKNNTAIPADLAITADQLLKETAFIYLKEALVAQQYEDCAGLIRDAKGFGAEQNEITAILAEYNCGYKAQWDSKAKTNKGPRF